MITDFLRAPYLGRVRMLRDRADKTWIRWYLALPDAKALPFPTPWGSHVWEGNFAEPFHGPGEFQRPQPWRPKRFPKQPGQHWHGPQDWFEHGIPAAHLGEGNATGECLVSVFEGSGGIVWGGAAITLRSRSWWSELIDRHEYEPRYGHRQVERNPSGDWVVVAGGPNGTLTSLPAWEVSGELAIPVPQTYVRMRTGTAARPFQFQHDDLEPIVRLTSETPDITLPAGRAFSAILSVAALDAGLPGEQEVTGGWIGAHVIYAIDLADADELPMGEQHAGRYLGMFEDTRVYAFRSDVDEPPPPPPPPPPPVVIVTTNITDVTNVEVYPQGQTVYIFQTSDGTWHPFVYLCMAGVCGWFDLCSCVWFPRHWWCSLSLGCVLAVDAPDDSLGGPYDTPEECAAACMPQWWCVESGGPTFTCTPGLTEPAGSVSGPYATEAECATVCGEPWWCVDTTGPLKWWCVATPASGPGVGDCDCCPDGAPSAWSFTAGPFDDPRFATLEGDITVSYDADGGSAVGACLWDTSPASDPVFPRWTLKCVGGAYVVQGMTSDGLVLFYRLDSGIACCDDNTIPFLSAFVPAGDRDPPTGLPSLVISPVGGCDPDGPPTTGCVQSATSPTGAIGGPFDSEEDCLAACGGGGGGVTVPCHPTPVPLVLRITYSGATGTCGCLDGETTDVTYANPPGQWAGVMSGCGAPDTTQETLSCNDGVWTLTGANPAIGDCNLSTNTATDDGSDPINLVFTRTVSGCCTGTVIATVTPVPGMFAPPAPAAPLVDSVACLQSASEPPTALGGPFSSEVDCLADCPPPPPTVCDCSECPAGASLSYNVPLGFTWSDCCAPAAGSWEVPHATGCNWSLTLPSGDTLTVVWSTGLTLTVTLDLTLSCGPGAISVWVGASVLDCCSLVSCALMSAGTCAMVPDPIFVSPTGGCGPCPEMLAPASPAATRSTSAAPSPARTRSTSAAPSPATRRIPCTFRQEYTGRTVACADAKKCRQKVYGCELYGECTIGVGVPGLACCASCPSYVARPSG